VMRSFSPTIVSGLLQTPAYARRIFDAPSSRSLSRADVDDAVAARLDRQRLLDDTAKRFVMIMTEGTLRWHAGSATLMIEQIEAIAHTAKRRNVRIGLIPWTTSVKVFPLHGFHLYDQDAAIVGTETATATITGAADVATYVELFTALEKSASFGKALQEHLARVADDYRTLDRRMRRS
jgi:Domain of unknown function (DUF5753)